MSTHPPHDPRCRVPHDQHGDLDTAAHLRQTRTVIDRDGWMIQGVFPDAPGAIGFAYTVGLTAAGLSELILSGSYDRNAQYILNTLAAQHLRRAGDGFGHGDTIAPGEQLLAPLRVIDAPRAPIATANLLYGHGRARAVQIVWHDHDGHWPGSVFARVHGQELFGDPWW